MLATSLSQLLYTTTNICTNHSPLIMDRTSTAPRTGTNPRGARWYPTTKPVFCPLNPDSGRAFCFHNELLSNAGLVQRFRVNKLSLCSAVATANWIETKVEGGEGWGFLSIYVARCLMFMFGDARPETYFMLRLQHKQYQFSFVVGSWMLNLYCALHIWVGLVWGHFVFRSKLKTGRLYLF